MQPPDCPVRLDTSSDLVRRRDVRPLDILVGRGHFKSSGNSRYLRIVSGRQADYRSAKYADKERIAREVLEVIYRPGGGEDGDDGGAGGEGHESDGDEDGANNGDTNNGNSKHDDDGRHRARFLQLEPEDQNHGDPDSTWRVVTGKAVLDKVKMNLRQKAKPKQPRDASNKGKSKVRAADSSGAAAAASSGTNRNGNTSMNAMLQPVGGQHIQSPEEKEQYLADMLDGGMFLDDDDLGDLRNLGEDDDDDGADNGLLAANGSANGSAAASAASASPQLSMPMPTPATASMDGEAARWRQRLLNNVAFAHSQARNLMLEHQEGQRVVGSATAAVPSSLEALGRALFAFFTGVDSATLLQPGANVNGTIVAGSGSPAAAQADQPDEDDDNSSAQQRQRKRTSMSLSSSASPGPSGALSDRLRDAGLPVSLCTVITSLLDATNPAASNRYLSSVDVEADLGRMISNPDRYLFDPPIDRHSGTLYFHPNRLYGRAKQWEQVRSAFDKIIVTQQETHGYLLISGPPGSGKTALVEKLLRDSLTERRGMFVWVKFDSQLQENPMTNICRGLDEYFQRLLQGDTNLLTEIASALKENLGPSMALLKDLIPTLGIVAEGWPELSYDTDRRETYNLILHCLKKVLNVIAHPSHPVIVLFDDLQWSDAASQEIIRMLVTDEASRAAMFIGCYRDNEVDENHPVAEYAGAILMSLVPFATITLRNLDKDSVNDLCSDVLRLSPRLTRPLAEALHSKTSGNPMFLRQLMRSLYEEGLLQYSASERRWRWDINGIRTKAVADNAVDLLIAMMDSYSMEMRWALQVASCLGFRFDETSIAVLASASDVLSGVDDIYKHIDVAMADGLLLKDGADTYRFSHDQIWLAAYSLTPGKERGAMHLRIGRKLHEELEQGRFGDSSLFAIADQYKRGIGAVTDHAGELEIAKLNLKAGELALSAFLFQPASTYLCAGVSLLKANDWDTEYTLCARLYSASAEVQLAQGRNEDALSSIAQVLANAKNTEDRVKAHEIQILANVAQAKFQDAIRESSAILGELGIDISNIDPASIQSEVATTRPLLESSDITDHKLIHSLVSKPMSTNSQYRGLMRILCFSSRAAYAASPPLMLYIILKMVQNVILSEEITAESSYAFGALSVAFCGLGFHQEAHLASKVALALLERFDGKYYNIVTCLVVSGSMPYIQPAQACIDLLRRSYRRACSVGDRDWAKIAINQISQISIMAPERGKSLADAEKEIRQMLAEFPAEEEDSSKSLTTLAMQYLQLLLNLKEAIPTSMATSMDPTVLTGSAMNQEAYLQICREKGVRDYFRHFYSSRLYLAYLFRRSDVSKEMAEALMEIAKEGKFCASSEMIVETFYMGLVAAAILQGHASSDAATDTSRWRQLVNNSLNSLTQWAEEGSEWNFRHKADLLRAEIAVANGDAAAAISSYRSAILGAGRSNYINEEALSCERAGLFLAQQGEIEDGRIYLRRAETLYNAWGARRKGQDVSSLINEHCS